MAILSSSEDRQLWDSLFISHLSISLYVFSVSLFCLLAHIEEYGKEKEERKGKEKEKTLERLCVDCVSDE